MSMLSGFYNCDCMEAMKQFPDGFFDLAIVDPPYGDGQNKSDGYDRFTPTGHFQRYKNFSGGGVRKPERRGGKCAAKYGKKIVAWDVAPEKEYFDELFRVSRNQVIWGGNYFSLPPTRCFLVWRKLSISESFTMAMCEYAWTSFFGNAKVFEAAPQGTSKEGRFHPTQKPIALYEWVLRLFAKPGMKILDTHVGSASSLIACHRAGLDYWGFEIDPDYYAKAKERLDKEKAQVRFMDLAEKSESKKEPEQIGFYGLHVP